VGCAFGGPRSDPSPMPAFPRRPMPRRPRCSSEGSITTGENVRLKRCLAFGFAAVDQSRVERILFVEQATGKCAWLLMPMALALLADRVLAQ